MISAKVGPPVERVPAPCPTCGGTLYVTVGGILPGVKPRRRVTCGGCAFVDAVPVVR